MTPRARSSLHRKPLWLALASAATLLLPGSSHAVASCAEIRAGNPIAGDSTYTLGLGGQPVDVFCHDMAGTPREYLTLPNTGSAFNYTHYGVSDNTSPTGQTTWFTKVRFNPATLTLLLDDTTFSTSEGWMQFGELYIYVNPLGGASDCVTFGSVTGRGNIDLRGTPFDIVLDQFVLGGNEPAGSATFSGTQIVNLTGGGYCGGIGARENRLRLNLRSAPEREPELVHRYGFTTSGEDSVGGAHGTLEGGATIANGEVVLPGEGAYVHLPIGGTLSKLQDATFEIWVKWSHSEAPLWGRIFDFNDNTQLSMYLASTQYSKLLFGITAPREREAMMVASHSQYPWEELTHLVVTMDHTERITRLYVNGLEVARGSTALTPASLGATPNAWLGRSLDPLTPFFKGAISELRIYRTVLSPSRIAAHFNAGDLPRVLATTISEGPANPTSQDATPFVFNANVQDLRYQCSVDEALFQPCTSPFVPPSLSDGSHTFRVQARDTMGNIEPSPTTYSWRVDKTPPETGFASTPEPATRLRNPTFSFTSNESRITFECSLDGAAFTECPGVFPALDDGEHRLAVRARDEVGNVDPDAAQHAWMVDTVAPLEPALLEPAPGQELFTAKPGFSGTAEPGTSVTLLIDGVEAGSVRADDQGVWRSLPEASLPWGAHRVSAKATDKAGNIGPLLPEVHFATSRRSAYALGCAAGSTSWQGSWPWALLLLGLLRPRPRPPHRAPLH
ncbi:LamG-like jellyroll fold domain-containing protein [Hyalangium rubrum]|uniref:LamG-like jellyroll fold domain-containing protein n=1 Tax=Hyalangium rubrum TaxID=3103134 RepID=A0ABU5GUW7_9BACT|nr:LamG-like jellyroll fold domain-containing protein [Hyalangium sp. s54d21]MDY7224891.1 LamG-like jellyroll fold domain-containing protein [Hyalangium sp. s54d21]